MSEARAQSTAKACKEQAHGGREMRVGKSPRVTLTRKLLRGLAKSRGSMSVGQWSGKQCVLDSTI